MPAKKSKLLLSIVIVSFNTAKLTKACLNSVVRKINCSQLLKEKTEIIVVDNASSDDSVDAILNLSKNIDSRQTQHHSILKLIQNKTNQGFGQANNQAAQVAKGKYLLFLNSDTLLKPKSLEVLINTIESQEAKKAHVKLLTASLLNANNSYQHQGGDLPNLLSVFGQWCGLDDWPILGQFFPSIQKKLPKNTLLAHKKPLLITRGWIGATALMIEKENFLNLDGFDKQIFMYGEDLDLCWRAHQLGMQSAIATSSFVVHFGSQSSSDTNAKTKEIQALFYFFKKYFSAWQTKILFILIAFGCFLRYLAFKLQNKSSIATFYKELGIDLLHKKYQ